MTDRNRLLVYGKSVLRKIRSARLLVIAGLLSSVEVALPFFSEVIPRGLFAVLSALAVGGAFVARLVAQKEVEQ